MLPFAFKAAWLCTSELFFGTIAVQSGRESSPAILLNLQGPVLDLFSSHMKTCPWAILNHGTSRGCED